MLLGAQQGDTVMPQPYLLPRCRAVDRICAGVRSSVLHPTVREADAWDFGDASSLPCCCHTCPGPAFFTGCSHRVLERERTKHFFSRAASLAAGLGPDWAQRFPQLPPYRWSRQSQSRAASGAEPRANPAHDGMAQSARQELLRPSGVKSDLAGSCRHFANGVLRACCFEGGWFG